MRVALLIGCAATVLGGIAFAAHFEARQQFQTDPNVVRYAYRPMSAQQNSVHGSFVVQARRQAFLGEVSPNEECDQQVSDGTTSRDERWTACMSRFTRRQVAR
jgi:hypothetical protein